MEKNFTTEELSSEKSPPRYPKKIIRSFQVGFIIHILLVNAGTQSQFFFQRVLGIEASTLALLGLAYMGLNAINDPIIGYLCDRPNKLTRKFGRRYPYIMIGGVISSFSLLLLYAVPSPEKIGVGGIIIYLVFVQTFNDSFLVLFSLNRYSLFPEKFRHVEDRKYGGMWQSIFETTGVLLAVAIPIISIEQLGVNRTAYLVFAAIILVVSIIILMFGIPGFKEDAALRARQQVYIKKKQVPFFQGMKQILTNKHFLGYVGLYSAYYTTMGLTLTSIPFFVKHILQMEKIGEFVIVAYIVGIGVAIPIWYKLSKKISIRKIAMIGGIMLGSMGIPFLFVPTGTAGLLSTIVIYFIAGFADGAMISMTLPLLSSILDYDTLKTGRRQEGHYNGVQAFIGSFIAAVPPIVYWAVQELSGYNPEIDTHTPEELLGLRIQVSLVPFVIMLSGVILFSLLYKLSTNKIQENSLKLKALNL